MSSILDIGPLTKTIKVAGRDIDINPVSAKIVFDLIWRFESFKKMMEGDLTKISPSEIVQKMAPDALAAVLVSVTGGVPAPNDAEVTASGGDYSKAFAAKQARCEAFASDLGVDAQSCIVETAFEITFPEGDVGPFVERLIRTAKRFGRHGLEQAMNLQGELSAALQMEDPNVKPGNLRRVK